MNSKQLATLMRLVGKQSTVATICSSIGITRQTIYKTLRALEHAKVARICDWKHDHTGRAVEPVWGLGDEPSVPRRRLTDAQKQRNYRQRKKKSDLVMQSMVAVATAPRPASNKNKARAG